MQFAGNAHFKDARLVGRWTVFNGAHFDGEAEFTGARFGTDALFQGAHFSRLGACFSKARFDNAKFDRAEFTGYASFDEAEFAGYTRLVEEQFSEGASFDRARVPSGSRTQLPAGWTTRDARTAEGRERRLDVHNAHRGWGRAAGRRGSQAVARPERLEHEGRDRAHVHPLGPMVVRRVATGS